MDNRRLARRQSLSRPAGLLDRVRRVFSNPALNPISHPNRSLSLPQHHFQNTQPPSDANPVNVRISMPGSFFPPPDSLTRQNSQITTPTIASENTLDGPSPANLSDASPNKLLADFFAKKGSTPLSEIEYAGVQALIARSDPTRAMPQTLENSLIHSPSEHHTYLDTNPKPKNLLRAAAAPRDRQSSLSAQRSFRNSSANTSLASTFDYTPANNTFAGSSAHPIKRVHRFNGLPLPYRTRIRAPLLGAGPNSSLANSSVSSSVLGPRLPNRSHPMSETALTLRAILDGNHSTSGESAVDRFANPYASARKRRRAPDAASLITNTLHTSEPVVKRQASDASMSLVTNREEKLPAKNLQSQAFTPSSGSAGKFTSDSPASRTLNVHPTDRQGVSNASNQKPANSNLSNSDAKSHNSSAKEPSPASIFSFPQPPQQKVPVDRKAVDLYKLLYLF